MGTVQLQPRLQVTNRNIDTGRSSATVIETSGGRGGCTTVSDMRVSPSRCGTGPAAAAWRTERLFPVFRDRHELSAGANLDDLVKPRCGNRASLLSSAPQTPPSRVRAADRSLQALGHETACFASLSMASLVRATDPSSTRECFSPPLHPQGRRPVGRLRTTCRSPPHSRDGKTDAN